MHTGQNFTEGHVIEAFHREDAIEFAQVAEFQKIAVQNVRLTLRAA